MSDKPKALRMADELDGLCSQYDSEIAAELRRLHAELERKSDAIQRLWKERDELRTLNAELTKALRRCMTFMQEEAKAYLAWHNDTNTILLAEIAALEEYLNDKG